MRVLPLLLPALLLAAGLASAQVQKPMRVALVIGNGKYAEAPLPNAVNDGADVAAELRAAGFTVIHRENASLREMHLALREFGDRLGRTSAGLFYFAGHGVQVRGRNYLLPVDADIAREDEVAFGAIDLGAVMEKLDSARNPVNLVILDACRNNPFARRFQVSQHGLAQVEAPPGTLIAFSTAPGSVADDGGTGRNGLYTRHLLGEMRRQGVSIEESLKAVRAAVRRESAGRQIPWESTSLETHFAFHAAPAAPVKPAAPPPGSKSAAGGRRAVSAPSQPPAFAAGDTWTYRVRNLADGSERPVTMSVHELRGAEVQWNSGQVSDLLGNFTRVRRGEGWRTYAPSTHMYVFPLNPGTRYTLAVEETTEDRRIFDQEVQIAIASEEDVATPAGPFRAIRIDREVRWAQRDKATHRGVSRWTYWYSAEAKRWVAAEHTNTTAAGKQLTRERWDLESYRVR